MKNFIRIKMKLPSFPTCKRYIQVTYITKLSLDCYCNCLHGLYEGILDFHMLLRYIKVRHPPLPYWDFVLMILDQWKNFLERLGSKVKNDDIRYWASFRGQTLSRTGNPEHILIRCITILSPWLPHLTPVVYKLSSTGNDVLQKSIETTGFLRQDKWSRCVCKSCPNEIQ